VKNKDMTQIAEVVYAESPNQFDKFLWYKTSIGWQKITSDLIIKFTITYTTSLGDALMSWASHR
jgi:hypothetical protein